METSPENPDGAVSADSSDNNVVQFPIAEKCSACSGWHTVSCTVCRGYPDEGVTLERIAAGVAAVARATRKAA
jgi:hypothetical protein